MSHSAPTRSRVRALCLWVMLGVVAGVLIQVSRLVVAAQQPWQEARLAVASSSWIFEENDVGDRAAGPTPAVTIIETLTSDEMHRRALARVRALNPELKECAVTTRAYQLKDSGMFRVSATGADAAYTRHFLDALLDEFSAFWQSGWERSRSRYFERRSDGLEKKRVAEVRAASTPELRQAIEKTYAGLSTELAQTRAFSEEAVPVAIQERAAPGPGEPQDWLLPLLAGAWIGALGGFIFFYLVSMLSALRALVAET